MMIDKESCLLLIDTATEICSVSLALGEKIVACKENMNGYAHAKELIPFVDEVMQEAKIEKQQITGVVLSIGPGSYTGLRIGASTAKGLCYALDVPLVAISTLQNIMMGARKEFSNQELLFCPMIDARRQEVYTALFKYDGTPLEEVHAQIVEETTFETLLQKSQVVFCGNGMPKCREMLSHYPNALFSDIKLSSTHMLEKALLRFEQKQFEDIAYFEPFYLKEYVAAKSHVKGLL